MQDYVNCIYFYNLALVYLPDNTTLLFRLAELRYQQSIQLQKSGNNRGNHSYEKSFSPSSSNSGNTAGDGDGDDDDEKNTTATTVDGLSAFQSNPFSLLRDGLATFAATNQTPKCNAVDEVCEETEWSTFQHLRYLK